MSRQSASGSRAGLYFLAFALAALLFFVLQQLLPAGVFNGLDRRASDWAWRFSAQHAPERRVVIVDVDESSLARLEPWPWPRARIAELSQRLADLGAAQQIFDILFVAPKAGDEELAKVLADNHAILANVFALDQGEAVQSGSLSGALQGVACAAPLSSARGFVGVAPALSGLPAGHITPRIDADGGVRRLPALVCHDGRAVPALALAAYWQGAGEGAELVRGAGLLEPAYWLKHRQGAAVPLDAATDLLVPYSLAPDALISISAADVLSGKAPRELLEGAWVLVGATALGLGDAVPTPHGGAVGGVSVHAQLISGLLDGALPYVPAGRLLLLAFPTALLCLALLFFAVRRGRFPVYVLPPLSVFAGLLMLLLHVFALRYLHWQLGWSQAALFVLCFGLLLSSVEFARARLEKERLYAHLASYLPAPVAQALLGRAAEAGAVAERRDVTVLFADIRNFSKFCETREPEAAAGVLHDFIGIATRIVEEHGGLIEAVQGDAIMAIWNGSRPCGEHARRAVAAARVLLPAVEAAFPQWPEDDLPPLALGIGIESGDALIGSFGPARRRIHTALGETVSIATAVQEMTAELACPILLGPTAAARVGEEGLRSQGDFLLEGLSKPHTLYALQIVAVDTP